MSAHVHLPYRPLITFTGRFGMSGRIGTEKKGTPTGVPFWRTGILIDACRVP